MEAVSAQITIRGSIERVWEFLTDYDSLSRHLSGLSESRLLRAENGYKVVEQVGRPGLPLLPAELAVRLRVVERRPNLISFEQIEGSFAAFQGSWELAPDGTGRTLVRYRLAATPRGWLPGRLVAPLLRRGMEAALGEVKAALESRHPEAGPPA